MGTTTMGVKLDEATRDRIKSAAQRIDRTPHWLIKQAIFNYLERLESGSDIPEIPALAAAGQPEADDIMPQAQEESHQPFLDFCRTNSAAVGHPRRHHRCLSSPGDRSGADVARTGAITRRSCTGHSQNGLWHRREVA